MVSSRSGTILASGMLSIWSATTLSTQLLSVLIVGLVPLLSLWRSIRIRRASRISSCSSRSCS